MRVGPAFLQTLAVQVTQSAASIVATILIARGLGPEGQGRYAFFAAAIAWGVVVAGLGQFESNVLSSAGRVEQGRALLWRSVLQTLVVALLLLSALPLSRTVLHLEIDTQTAVLFVLILALELEAQLLRGINLGQHHITAYNLSPLIQRLVLLAGVGVLSARAGLRLVPVLAVWSVATGLSVLITGWWVWRRSTGTTVSRHALWEGWRLAAQRGARALITLAITLALLRCDIWMLRPMLGVSTVGQVSVAIGLAEWLWYVPYILGTVLFAAAAADSEAAIDKIGRASRGVILLVWPIAFVLLLVGQRVVPLIYGRQYEPAGLLFVSLIPGMAAIAVHIVVDSYFAGKGFPPISVWSAVGALLAKVVLNLVMVPRLGALGATLSTSLVYIALLAVKVVALVRTTRVSVRDLLLPTPADFRSNAASAALWVRERLGAVVSPP